MAYDEGMDDGHHLPAGRKAQIAACVTESGQVTVAALARRFQVSVDTIRRDLDQLDNEGVIIRTHGGAMSTNAVPWHDTQLDERRRLRPKQKETIAKLASSLVEDGSVLLVNGGTTTLGVAAYLAEKRSLIIATNSLLLPSKLPPECCRDVYMLSGRVRLSGAVSIGSVAFPNPFGSAPIGIRADIALLGVGAVHSGGGFSTTNLAEAKMIAEMAKASRKVAVLADSTKFDQQLFATIGSLSMADYLVCDAKPGKELCQALEDNGVSIICP